MRHTVVELKVALKAQVLRTTGLKANLANRLAQMATQPSGRKLGPKMTIDQLISSAASSGRAGATDDRSGESPLQGERETPHRDERRSSTS